MQGSNKSLLWMDTLLKTKVWMLVTVIWETRVIKVGCLFAFFCFLLFSSVSLSVSWGSRVVVVFLGVFGRIVFVLLVSLSLSLSRFFFCFCFVSFLLGSTTA